MIKLIKKHFNSLERMDYCKISLYAVISTLIMFCILNGCEASKEMVYKSQLTNLISKGVWEKEYQIAREDLIEEVDKYIKKIAPKSQVTSSYMVDLCMKYNVDIRLVLAQGHVESHFATRGTARKTNSIFNVGAYDGDSADTQKKKGFSFKTPDDSIEPYLKLLTTKYLVDGKSELDMLECFENYLGQRYASSKRYEKMLIDRWSKMDSISDAWNRCKECYINLNIL